MIELLSPVGSFDCLKAAVQNGADSVYFGADGFNARAFASNFSFDELKNAISYAKIRGVKTHLTLNTLIKDNEFDKALLIAKKAYEYGIDAIIVQDLGLSKILIDNFPNLEIHASTQMTVHNLQGVLEMENLGFKRVVLSRELSINEIEYICNNSNVDIECFIHGALCISYSGQCLMSSIVGGRSGNRGKCAGPCRLPYKLYENSKKIDSGYLLSTRDLCGLDYIPDLINAGVKCFKIEGRMKSPEYVAIVTKIYRKYIDLALSDKKYKVLEEDKKELLQAFNRGLSSSGHLDKDANKNLVFKDKPNNMGLFLGIIQKYSNNKYITLKLNEPLNVGDTISIENEQGTYTISELMRNEVNINQGEIGETVCIGRMKGKINLGDKLYKMSSKNQLNTAKESFQKELKKVHLNCIINIKKGKNISIEITSASNLILYKDMSITCEVKSIPVEAKNYPLTKDKVIEQISKTSSTPYEFKKITVNLDENTFIPKISSLNELRRIGINMVENYAKNHILRTSPIIKISKFVNKNSGFNFYSSKSKSIARIAVLLNELNLKYNYANLDNINDIYIPLKYFSNKNFDETLKILSTKFNMYIYLPTITKANYINLSYQYIKNSLEKHHIKGFILSNISNILLLEDIFKNKKFNFIANYTFNVFNHESLNVVKNLGLNGFTLSPELDKKSILSLSDITNFRKELIVYGNIPLMNMNYCLLGNSNKCYPECESKCQSVNKYYLKDRLGMNFKILPDNVQTVTTIYNSKITSIASSDFDIDVARIDILDEKINEINNIVNLVKKGKRLEGKEFTNGNLNKKI